MRWIDLREAPKAGHLSHFDLPIGVVPAVRSFFTWQHGARRFAGRRRHVALFEVESRVSERQSRPFEVGNDIENRRSHAHSQPRGEQHARRTRDVCDSADATVRAHDTRNKIIDTRQRTVLRQGPERAVGLRGVNGQRHHLRDRESAEPPKSGDCGRVSRSCRWDETASAA